MDRANESLEKMLGGAKKTKSDETVPASPEAVRADIERAAEFAAKEREQSGSTLRAESEPHPRVNPDELMRFRFEFFDRLKAKGATVGEIEEKLQRRFVKIVEKILRGQETYEEFRKRVDITVPVDTIWADILSERRAAVLTTDLSVASKKWKEARESLIKNAVGRQDPETKRIITEEMAKEMADKRYGTSFVPLGNDQIEKERNRDELEETIREISLGNGDVVALIKNRKTGIVMLYSPIIERIEKLTDTYGLTKTELDKIEQYFPVGWSAYQEALTKARMVARQLEGKSLNVSWDDLTELGEAGHAFEAKIEEYFLAVGRAIDRKNQMREKGGVSSETDSAPVTEVSHDVPLSLAAVSPEAESSKSTPSVPEETPPFRPDETQEWVIPLPEEEDVSQTSGVMEKSATSSPGITSVSGNEEIFSIPPPPPGSGILVKNVDISAELPVLNDTVDSMPKGMERGSTRQSEVSSEKKENAEQLVFKNYFTRRELDREHPKVPEAMERLLSEHGIAGVLQSVDEWFSDLPEEDRADIKRTLERDLEGLSSQSVKEKAVHTAEFLRKIARGEEVDSSSLEQRNVTELQLQFESELTEIEQMLVTLGAALKLGSTSGEIMQTLQSDRRFESVPWAAFDHKKKSLEGFFRDVEHGGVYTEDVLANWTKQCQEFTGMIEVIKKAFDDALPDTDERIVVPPVSDQVPDNPEPSPEPIASVPEAVPDTHTESGEATGTDGNPPVVPVGSGGGSGSVPPNTPTTEGLAEDASDRFSYHDVEVIDRELREALSKVHASATDIFSVSDGSQRITIDTLRNAIDLLLDVREMGGGDKKNLTVTERYGSLTHNKEDVAQAEKIVAFAAPSFLNYLHEKQMELANRYGGKDALEAMQGYRPDPEVLIPEAQSFEELYKVLADIGSINGPRKILLADELIDIVKHVRAGEYTLDAVPTAYNLQKKVDELTKEESLRILEQGRKMVEQKFAAAISVPSTPEAADPTMVSNPDTTNPEASVSPTPDATPVNPDVPAASAEQVNDPQSADTAVSTSVIESAAVRERFAEVRAIKETPEYQEARQKWLEARAASAANEQKYQEALTAYYKDLQETSYKNIKRWGYEAGKLFGFKPSLTPELLKMKEDAAAAHEAYKQNGVELSRIRKGLEHEERATKALDRYGRLLARKTLLGPLSGRLQIQKEALSKINPNVQKSLEWLANHPKTTIAVGAGAFGIIGASGGALAGLAAGAGYVASAGAGMFSGLTTRGLLNRFYVGQKKEQLNTSQERAKETFFEKSFSDQEKLLEFRQEAIENAQRTTTAASIGAAFGAGMAAGSLYNSVVGTPGIEAGAEIKNSGTNFENDPSFPMGDGPRSGVSSVEVPSGPSVNTAGGGVGAETVKSGIPTAPPGAESVASGPSTPVVERPTFLTSNGTPNVPPEGFTPSPDTFTPESVVQPEIMPDAEQVYAAPTMTESIVSEVPAASTPEVPILDDSAPQLNQAPEVIQVSANQPVVSEDLDLVPQNVEAVPGAHEYSSVGDELLSDTPEAIPVVPSSNGVESGVMPPAPESLQKIEIANVGTNFENDPSFPMGDGPRWGTSSVEASVKPVSTAEVGALGLAGLTLLGIQKRKSIWDSILSKGKLGGLIGLIFGGRKKKEAPVKKK